MCGRFAFYSTIAAINKSVNVKVVDCTVEPSYNIAPMDEILIVTQKKDTNKG